MPRKLPSKTKFVRYARWMSFAAVQRMSASSTKSMRKLSPKSRTRATASVRSSTTGGSAAAAAVATGAEPIR
jgi:hypothetical protein